MTQVEGGEVLQYIIVLNPYLPVLQYVVSIFDHLDHVEVLAIPVQEIVRQSQNALQRQQQIVLNLQNVIQHVLSNPALKKS